MNQRKVYRFDFGNEKRITVSVGGEESLKRLRTKLKRIEEKVNWDVFKETVRTIKKK
jgi:hypothetical protein